jgi:RHS repeat-associated protein
MIIAAVVLGHRIGFTYPGNVFTNATPVQAPSVEDKINAEEATHSVGESGTAHYTIPITVPPGRQGMQPKIALSYSSRNPIRGGLAAGWTLSIPRIEVDTSQGRLGGTFYRSSISGTRLVRVSEPVVLDADAYRAEQDTTYARYERVRNPDGSTRMWRMRTTDGHIWYFGETIGSFDRPVASSAGGPVKEGRWFLSRVEDKFGNRIQYGYAPFQARVGPNGALQTMDIYPARITWGHNQKAGLQDYAMVVFYYDDYDKPCEGSNLPIGSQLTYRMGFPIFEGAKRLVKISVGIIDPPRPPEVRTYELAYDMSELSCPTGMTHAPLRLLTSIQETAVAPNGTRTALPPVKFTYGRRELELTHKITANVFSGAGHNALSLEKAGGWPTVSGMMLDFDGDGRLDTVSADPKGDPIKCKASWSRNLGNQLGTGGHLLLPTIPWSGPQRYDIEDESVGEYSTPYDVAQYDHREGCSISHQFSRVIGQVKPDSRGNKISEGWVPPAQQAGFPATYNSYRFIDVTGDGRPDLVTAIDTNRGQYRPEEDVRLWPPNKPFPACIDQGACRSAAEPPLYLVAEGGGGGLIRADRSEAREWETFTIKKVSTETETITIPTPFGSPITETRTIRKLIDGPIANDDDFALLTYNGQYVAVKQNADTDGDHPVYAFQQTQEESATLRMNEVFRLKDHGLGIISLETRLKAEPTEKVAQVIVKESADVVVKFAYGQGTYFTLTDLNGGALQSGDKVHFRRKGHVPQMCDVGITGVRTSAELTPRAGTITSSPDLGVSPPLSNSPKLSAFASMPPTALAPLRTATFPHIKMSIPMLQLRALKVQLGPVDDGGSTGTSTIGCSGGSCQDPRCTHWIIEEPGGCPYPCSTNYCPFGTAAKAVGSSFSPPIDHSDGIEADSPLGRFWTGPHSIERPPSEIGNEKNPSNFGNPLAAQVPETRCGRYVFRVYENTGTGFASEPKIILSPVPLETDRATSQLGAGDLAASSSYHGFLDLDGDGNLDAIHKGIESFDVFRGDGSGNFRPGSQGIPYLWPLPAADSPVKLLKGRSAFRLAPQTPDVVSQNKITATSTAVTLRDVNGDGLPDYIDARELVDTSNGKQQQVQIYYNTGTGFEHKLDSPGLNGHTLETSAWGTEKYAAFEETRGFLFQPSRCSTCDPLRPDEAEIKNIWSRAVAQVVDIDVDGLLDLVLIQPPRADVTNPWQMGPLKAPPQPRPPIPSPPSRLAPGTTLPDLELTVEPGQPVPIVARLFINVGDKLVPMGQTAKLATWWPALARITLYSGSTEVKVSRGSVRRADRWQVVTDFVDLDGDGLPEAVTNDDRVENCSANDYGNFDMTVGSGCELLYSAWTSPQPSGDGMRLLRTIENGRGGTVRFDYKPLGVDAGGRVPYPLWVVASVTVNGGPGAAGPSPDQVTTYDYKEPIYNQDSHGDWGFRGFRSFEKIGPSPDPSKTGALTITTFDYTLYWGGLPIAVHVFDDKSRQHPQHITKTVWGRDQLWASDLVTYHRREVETRTCLAVQDEPQCEAQGLVSFDIYEWVPLRPNVGLTSPPNPLFFLHVEKSHWIGETRDAQNTPDSKGRLFFYAFLSTTEDYRLVITETQRYVGGNPPIAVGKTVHKYDARLLFEVATTQYRDADTRSAATTARSYTPAGNLQSIVKPNFTGQLQPEQVAPSAPNCTGTTQPPSSTLCYDVRQIFVSKTVNELGHEVESTYDLATGVQLSSRGPNLKQIGSIMVKDGWDRLIDGFGRPLQRRQYLDDPTGYVPVVMIRNEFYDAPVQILNGHAGVITRKRIEIEGERWTDSRTEVDGLARVVVTTDYAGNAATPAAIGRFFYDPAGNLARAELPHPNRPPGTDTVAYELFYDPHGRRTLALRPDKTGQSWIYDGRSLLREDVVRQDVPPEQRGVVSRTRTLVDAFGRLIKTEEQLDAGVWGSTMFLYDGNDNTKSIKNADGIETTMEHDWLSRRTGVIRGGQIWQYGYDLDGNMTNIGAPPPPAVLANPTPSTLAAYATTITYDALDRPVRREAGSRALTENQLGTYGAASTKYVYDQAQDQAPGQVSNSVGRLTALTQPHGSTRYTYDARGLVVKEERNFSILNNQFQDHRWTERRYNALGLLSRIVYADGQTLASGAPGASGSAGPTIVTLTYDDRGLPTLLNYEGRGPLGQAQYSAGGRVAVRQAGLPGATQYRIEYTYDDLGRVTRQLARTQPPDSSATTLVNQHYAYTGSDDVASLDLILGPGNQAPVARWTFEHDQQHQLTGARLHRPSGSPLYEGTFTYSPAGLVQTATVNAAQAPDVPIRTVSYVYNVGDREAPDALIQPNGMPWMSLTYDEAGNVTKRALNNRSWSHIYDGEDLQREVVRQDEGRELYWYDHGHQRSLIATISDRGLVTRVRWVFGETEIWYQNGGKVEKTLAMVGIGGLLARIENASQTRFLFQNPRSDLLLALDESGQIAGDFTYGPYGERLREEGMDKKNVVERFNGKQFDDASGLHYYGYRYFDERSLTWTQADPLYRFAPDIARDQPRRFATYAFSLNNPLRHVDPNGLGAWSWFRGNVWIPVVDPVDEFDPYRTWDFTTATVEVGAGLLACKTGVGCAAGVAMVINGVDDLQAAVRGGRTGKEAAVTHVTGSKTAGQVADMGISLLVGGGAVVDLIKTGLKEPKVANQALETISPKASPKGPIPSRWLNQDDIEAAATYGKYKFWFMGGLVDTAKLSTDDSKTKQTEPTPAKQTEQISETENSCPLENSCPSETVDQAVTSSPLDEAPNSSPATQ